MEHVGEKRHLHTILVGKCDEKRHWEDLSLGYRALNGMLNRKEIHLTEDVDQWQAVVRRVMNSTFCT